MTEHRAHNLDVEKLMEGLRQEFVDGSSERLDQIDTALADLKGGIGDFDATFAVLQRDIHSIKGTAGSYGFSVVTSIAHALEDYIEASNTIGKRDLNAIQYFVDEIRRVLESGENPTGKEAQNIIDRLPIHKEAIVSEQQQRVVQVLIIMPKNVQRKIVGTEMVSCGFRVAFADTALLGIEKALALKPDIIISGREIDGISGPELAWVFDSIEKTRHSRFVLLISSELTGAGAGLPPGVDVVHKGGNFSEELSGALLRMGAFEPDFKK